MIQDWLSIKNKVQSYLFNLFGLFYSTVQPYKWKSKDLLKDTLIGSDLTQVLQDMYLLNGSLRYKSEDILIVTPVSLFSYPDFTYF